MRITKPRYRLVTTTALYYHFVNVHSSGIAREHYTIRRAEFWGWRPVPLDVTS